MNCRVSIVLFCWSLLVPAAPGAQRTWDGGGGDADWRTAQNWDGNIFLPIPIAQGDTLVFPAGPSKLVNTNDFGAGTNFNALMFSGEDYIVRGNMIGLTNGISITHPSGGTSLYLPITLRDDQSFTVSSAGAFLYLNGDVAIGDNALTFDGAGNFVLIGEITNGRFGIRRSVRKNGTGRLTIFQPTDHDVPTIVNGGILAVEHRMTNSSVTVNAGGTLRGSGKIGGLNGNGGIIQPGGTTPDALECYGDVALGAGTTLRLRLNGTTAGVTYDQLDVRGAVTLGGTLEILPGFLPAVGDRFTIIANDGSDGIVGTFDGLPDGAIFTVNGRPYQIDYGRRDFFRHNDVVIEAVPALAVWDGGGAINRRWSQPANWVGDVVPYPGDDLYFPNPVTTTNDFPAGHRFGSITFGGGNNRVEGNPAVFDGSLSVNGPADIDIYVPMTLGRGFRLIYPGDLTFHAPITLSGSQTFAIEHTNLLLHIDAGIHVGPHDLTLDNELWDRDGYYTHASIYLYEFISGSGRLIKEGPGQCRLLGCEVMCSETIINEGDLSEAPHFTGAVAVNAGGRMLFPFAVAGPIVINPGGVWDGGRHLTNVTVNGGTFAPEFFTLIYGGLRMVSNATYEVHIQRDPGGRLNVTGATAGGPVVLSNTMLNVLQIDSGALPHGSNYVILNPNPATASRFHGLADGARVVVGPNALTLTYQGGELFVLSAGSPFVWDGGGADAYWTTPENWVADVAPLPFYKLIFPLSASRRLNTNDFPAHSAFSALIFDGTSYNLRGNPLRLTNGIFQNVAGENTAALGMRFSETGFGSVSTNPAPAFVAASSLLRLEGSLSNSFVRKIGPGTLRLGGAENNPRFSLHVLEGLVDLNKSSGASAITETLAIGDGTNIATVHYLGDDQLADTADVTVRRGARLQLNGHTDATDGLSGDGVTFLGGVTPGRLIVLGSGTFSGEITGNGGITKAGTGVFILAGTNFANRGTSVEGGMLQVDGMHLNSTIALNGGTLAGRGRVASVEGGLGGVLAPGRHQATFQNFFSTGNVQLNENSTFQPRLTSLGPDFENTRLVVTGTVNLGGSTLRIVRFMDTPTNATFIVIDNDGADAIAGTFQGVPEGAIVGANGQAFRVSYTGGTGNDLVLTRVTAPPATFSGIQRLGTNEVQIQGLGLGNVDYVVQQTLSLSPPIQWISAGNVAANSNGVWSLLQTASRTQVFYRAVSP